MVNCQTNFSLVGKKSLANVDLAVRLDGVVWHIIDDSPNLPNIPTIWYTYVASYCVCCLYSQDC